MCNFHLCAYTKVKHIQAVLRKLHADRSYGIVVRSPLQKLGIYETPEYAHVLHEKNCARGNILNQFIGENGETYTGNQMYTEVRNQFKKLYQKQQIDEMKFRNTYNEWPKLSQEESENLEKPFIIIRIGKDK